MEPGESSSRSQMLIFNAILRHFNPIRISTTDFPKISDNIIIQSMPRSLKWCLPNQNSVYICFPQPATCFTHPVLTDLTIEPSDCTSNICHLTKLNAILTWIFHCSTAHASCTSSLQSRTSITVTLCLLKFSVVTALLATWDTITSHTDNTCLSCFLF